MLAVFDIDYLPTPNYILKDFLQITELAVITITYQTPFIGLSKHLTIIFASLCYPSSIEFLGTAIPTLDHCTGKSNLCFPLFSFLNIIINSNYRVR